MENFQLRVDSINKKENPDEEEQQIQTRINIKEEKRAAIYQEVEMLDSCGTRKKAREGAT